jgi:hypothetical protein
MAAKSSKNQKTPPPPPSEVLRQTVSASGQSMYRLAKDSGLSYAQVWRFVAGERSLNQDAFDQLCQHLGLRLVKEEKE